MLDRGFLQVRRIIIYACGAEINLKRWSSVKEDQFSWRSVGTLELYPFGLKELLKVHRVSYLVRIQSASLCLVTLHLNKYVITFRDCWVTCQLSG